MVRSRGCEAALLLFLTVAPVVAGAQDSASTAQPADDVEQLIDEGAASGEPWRIEGESLTGSVSGPVEIVAPIVEHGSLRVGARRGVWRPAEQLVELAGDVTIDDGTRRISAASGSYQRNKLLLELDSDVHGEGPEGHLQAEHLVYDRAQRLLSVSGRVRLDEDKRTLESDWLRYEIADSFMTAGGSVHLREMPDSVDAYGDLLFLDRATDRATLLGEGPRRPRLIGEKTATEARGFDVEADTLRFYTTARIGEASGRVVLDRGGVHGFGERARFEMDSNRLILSGAPQVRDTSGVITGDSMLVTLHEGMADRLTVWGHAAAEYLPPERPGEAHFTLGDSLSAFFESGAMRSVVISGAAQALYLPVEADKKRGVGIDWTRGDRLRLLFKSGRVDEVQFEGAVNGRYVLPREGGAALPETTKVSRREVPKSTRELLAEIAESTSVSRAKAAEPTGLSAALAAIRARSRTGTLEASDSLVNALGFDPQEAVTYSGAALAYSPATQRITISGKASVDYRGMALSSEEIVFDSPRDLIIAQGEPLLADRGTEVRGQKMTYRIDTRKGLVFAGRSEFEGGYYQGGRVKRVSEKTAFVSEADFTSCNAAVPHYHFHADEMKVIADERAIARPVILYLGNIPLFAIPYATFPLRRGRQSGLLVPEFEVGFDTARGRFLRNVGYYYAPNDYWDGLFWLDYFENEPSTALNARVRYSKRYMLSGRVEGSYSHETSLGHRRDRWLLRIDHDQQLADRFNFKVSGDFQSDKDYAADRDFGVSVDETINRVLRSQMSINKSWSSASVSVLAERDEYLERTTASGDRIVQSAPSINASLSSFAIGARPDARGYGGRLPAMASTYVRADFRFRSVYTKPWTGESEYQHAAGINASLSDKRRLFGSINLTPSFSLSSAWASEDREGRPNELGASWRAGFSAGTTMYGTFLPRLGPWEGLRHVIELSSSYSYSPELRALEDFPSIGGISLSSAKSSRVSLRMTQRFHVKLRKGEETTKHENLLIWDTSTGYDFLAKERAREQGVKAHPWSNMVHSLRLQPGDFFSSEFSLTHDLEKWQRSSLALRTTMRIAGGGEQAGAIEQADGEEAGTSGYGDFGDPEAGAGTGPDRKIGVQSLTGPWRVTVSHVFSMGRTWESRQSSLNVTAGLSLTPGWRMQYSIYYDLVDSDVISQGYSLYRDLHCWQASLERRSSGGRSSYYFRISIKDLPDIKYERRRGY